jgi:CHAD domain-containing protein
MGRKRSPLDVSSGKRGEEYQLHRDNAVTHVTATYPCEYCNNPAGSPDRRHSLYAENTGLSMAVSPSGTDRTTPLLRARVRDVFRHLPKALTGEEEAIHQMRVAGRRLRIALPHLARRPAGKRVRRALVELKRLSRGAGASRDLDVMLGLFEEQLQHLRTRNPAQAMLLRRLRAARTRSRAKMAEALLDLEIARLRRDLRAVVARKGEAFLQVLLRLGQTEGAEGGALVATFQTLGDRFDPEALHRLRIGARRLRYAAELHLELSRRQSPAPEVLKSLQEDLGTIRDFYLVSAWLSAQRLSAEMRGDSAVAAESKRLGLHFSRLSRAKHRELLDSDPIARLSAAVRSLNGQRKPAA